MKSNTKLFRNKSTQPGEISGQKTEKEMSTIIRKQTELNSDQLEALKSWAKTLKENDFANCLNNLQRVERIWNIEMWGICRFTTVIRYGEVFIFESKDYPGKIGIFLLKSAKKVKLVAILSEIDYHFNGCFAVPNLLPF